MKDARFPAIKPTVHHIQGIRVHFPCYFSFLQQKWDKAAVWAKRQVYTPAHSLFSLLLDNFAKDISSRNSGQHVNQGTGTGSNSHWLHGFDMHSMLQASGFDPRLTMIHISGIHLLVHMLAHVYLCIFKQKLPLIPTVYSYSCLAGVIENTASCLYKINQLSWRSQFSSQGKILNKLNIFVVSELNIHSANNKVKSCDWCKLCWLKCGQWSWIQRGLWGQRSCHFIPTDELGPRMTLTISLDQPLFICQISS